MRKTLLATGTLLAALVAGPALAFPGHGMFGGGDFDFAAADTDKDGKLSEAELTAHRTARFAEADADGDGFLTRAEVAAAMQARMADRIDRMAGRAIVAMDDDGDGKLSAAEIAPGKGAGRLFGRADADGDGFLSPEEMEEMHAHRRVRMVEHGGMGGYGGMGGQGGMFWPWGMGGDGE